MSAHSIQKAHNSFIAIWFAMTLDSVAENSVRVFKYSSKTALNVMKIRVKTKPTPFSNLLQLWKSTTKIKQCERCPLELIIDLPHERESVVYNAYKFGLENEKLDPKSAIRAPCPRSVWALQRSWSVRVWQLWWIASVRQLSDCSFGH